jgi:hypothetical protein
MIVAIDSTDVTTYFVLRKAADGTELTGATITNIDLVYTRSGADHVAKVDATACAAVDAAHADNTAIEVDSTSAPGLYRVDWPDAAFAAGAREVVLTVVLATAFTEHMRVELSPSVNTDSFTVGAITAAAIATGAIDADAIATDAGAELADAVWDEATSGHLVAGTTGKALGDAGAAGDPWTAATRTLTSSAAATVAAMSGSALVVTKSVTYGATISGLTIPASWKAIYLTAKASTSLADSAAQIQIQESVAGTGDGLLYIHGNTAAEAGLAAADASLTVSQAAGTIAIVIDDEATAELVAGTYSYDVKCLLADGTSQQLSGAATFTVQDAVTETV